MNARFEGRLVRLERQQQPSYSHLIGVPMRLWPDAALQAFVCAETGEAWHLLSDAELLAIVAQDGAG